ncbi:MAG TPA: glycosyltransferase family A protein [Candidatus Acidoferrales bacterium]|nr:glycosyltransferase family A protein [Candidatus Acidoferrales bacterium]
MSARFDAAVVIPVRDGLPDVLEAVASALAQTQAPAEIVVVDDASQDGSGDAVERRFGARVRLVRGRFGSAAAARNAGWRACRAPFVAFLDADDLWRPEKLAVAAECFAAAPAADWFFSDGAFRTLDGQLHASWFGLYADLAEPWCGAPLAQLFEVNFVLTSSAIVRRSALEALDGFDERLSHAEDLDLWIRLSRRGLATASRRALVRYQHREGGLTRQTESRLRGGIALFSRLAADVALPPALRRSAARRASLYRYKLALNALRAGRRAEARGGFASAWHFPERTVPVALGLAATLLPPALFGRLRGRRAAVAAVTPMVAVRRVVLRGWDDRAVPRAAGEARRERP